jgi:hypothetical protein
MTSCKAHQIGAAAAGSHTAEPPRHRFVIDGSRLQVVVAEDMFKPGAGAGHHIAVFGVATLVCGGAITAVWIGVSRAGLSVAFAVLATVVASAAWVFALLPVAFAIERRPKGVALDIAIDRGTLTCANGETLSLASIREVQVQAMRCRNAVTCDSQPSRYAKLVFVVSDNDGELRTCHGVTTSGADAAALRAWAREAALRLVVPLIATGEHESAQ